MDGGMRSPANVDLAAGCDRIVVLAPVVQGFGAAMPSVTRQCEVLKRAGSTVALVTPSRPALAAIGRNTLDSTRRAPAAEAGYQQAAAAIATVWSAPRPA
jgi:NTE family protein